MDSKKIHVDKNDDLAIVSQQVFSSDTDRIVLVVPKFSKIAETVDDLKFLKKGLSKTDKELVIESVDDTIIALAKKAKIEAYNPFFVRQAKAVNSLMPEMQGDNGDEGGGENDNANGEGADDTSDEDDGDMVSPEKKEGEPSYNPYDDVGEESDKSEDEFDVAQREIDTSFDKRELSKKHLVSPVLHKSNRSYAKMRNSLLAASVIVGASAWLGLRVLPQASIHITAKKIPWHFDQEMVIDKSAVLADIALLKIPGQVFSQTRNSQGFYMAKEKKQLNEKARGILTVHNNYSTQPQALVANTRFQTPDGKIIRLEKPAIIPPANKIGGKIEPSSIEVGVIADVAGKEYNIGPFQKLTIPGFADNPDKFKGFYGELKRPMSGGFVGEKTYPSEAEIQKAKEDNMKKVSASLISALDTRIPNDFTILDGVQKIRIVKEDVHKDTNEKGEFSVYSEAEVAIIGFREKDVLTAIQKLMREDLKKEDIEIKSQDISYVVKGVDNEKDILTIQVTYNAVVTDPLRASDIRKKIAGKSEGDLKALMYSIAGLEDAEISLSPFWVKSVPENESKITVRID